MSKDKRDDSSLERDVRKFMSDEKHSPFYNFQEVAEGIGFKKDRTLFLSPYGRLETIFASMQCRHVIIAGGAAAPDKYALRERSVDYYRKHENQIL